jgi:hypothetical protein
MVDLLFLLAVSIPPAAVIVAALILLVSPRVRRTS